MENKEQNTGMSLEQAAKRYLFDNEHHPFSKIQDAFKAGASWQSSQPINSGWVSVDIANKILKVRDALVKDDWDEAYHQLCLIADPTLTNLNHWEKLERIADELPSPPKQ